MTSNDDIVSRKIYELFGIPVLPLRFKRGSSDITCLLPLKYVGSSSLEKSTIKVCIRKLQPSRGKYFQLSGGRSLHVVMHQEYMIAEKETESALGGAWPCMHVSHLCHHWWCCNPNHLVKEPDFVNIMRKSCPSPVRLDMSLDFVGCQCTDLRHPKLSSAPKSCLWYTQAKVKKLALVDGGLDPGSLPGDTLTKGDFERFEFYLPMESNNKAEKKKNKNKVESAQWSKVKKCIREEFVNSFVE